MQYEFSEEERSVQQTAARFLEELASKQTWDAEAPGAFDEADLKAMGELGFFALAIPERLGGLELGYPAQGLVLESAGYHLIQGPLLDHCTALSILEQCPQHESLIPQLLSGESLATVAFGWRGNRTATLNVDEDGDASGFALAGYADVADFLVALAAGPEGELQVGAAESEHFIAAAVQDEDYSWRGSGISELKNPELVNWAGYELSEGLRIIATASSLSSAFSLGCAQRLLDDTVAYVGERKQFGKPIGSFQAIKHRIADLYIEIEHTRSLVYAALGMATGESLLGFMAKRSAASTFSLASRVALQSHGGIGFTWESPLHHYVRAGLRLNAWPLPRATVEDLIYDLAVENDRSGAATS